MLLNHSSKFDTELKTPIGIMFSFHAVRWQGLHAPSLVLIDGFISAPKTLRLLSFFAMAFKELSREQALALRLWLELSSTFIELRALRHRSCYKSFPRSLPISVSCFLDLGRTCFAKDIRRCNDIISPALKTAL